MSFSVEIKGGDKLLKQLGAIPDNIKKEVGYVFIAGVLGIHSEAVKSIQEHRSQGITYKRGGISHTASKPGFPPNSDTGTAAKSIMFNIDKEKLIGEVGTNLRYLADLEFGTERIEERPWLGPAYRKKYKEIMKDLKDALKRALKV